MSLESLEPRLALYAPGGNVAAQLLGSTLLLTGDALDNTLVVASATGGRMAVVGAPGTTINGADAMVTPFVTNRAVTSIVATLNGGNDVIEFTNDAIGLSRQIWFSDVSVPFSTGDLQAVLDTVAPGVTAFTLPRSLTVTTGAGNDFVGIIGDVGGSIAANLGSALSGPTNRNTFTIGDPLVSSVTNRVGGSVSVAGGDQNDVSLINGTDVGGVVAYALGNGRNGVTVNGDRPTLGSFAYTGGNGR